MLPLAMPGCGGSQVKGSATACILRCLPDEGELHAANLGDSGFLLVRGGNPVFQTPQQQHHFNFPYQLGSKAMGAMNDGPESAQVRIFYYAPRLAVGLRRQGRASTKTSHFAQANGCVSHGWCGACMPFTWSVKMILLVLLDDVYSASTAGCIGCGVPAQLAISCVR